MKAFARFLKNGTNDLNQQPKNYTYHDKLTFNLVSIHSFYASLLILHLLIVLNYQISKLVFLLLQRRIIIVPLITITTMNKNKQ